ncbi:MAG: ATP synthase F1 subunit epsilon [Candidatus Andersenbacteria bacterium]
MLKLRIVTIAKVVADQPVEELYVETPLGQTGVLPSHAAMLTAVKPGLVRFKAREQEVRLVSTGGSLEVKDNKATLLVDEAVPVESIDVRKAEAERSRLLNYLESGELTIMELRDARKQLANVSARIRFGGK